MCKLENTVLTGALIILYTMISSSTANVAVICLPFLKSEYMGFPDLSIVSGLMSTAKIVSSFLIFVFPTRNYEIMIVLGVKAVLMAALSKANTLVPEHYQGLWVSVCIILLTFSCGTTVARALTITSNDEDTKILSNCFTIGKSSVHAVELLATTIFFQYFQWDGMVVWVCGAYSVVTLATLGMYFRARVWAGGEGEGEGEGAGDYKVYEGSKNNTDSERGATDVHDTASINLDFETPLLCQEDSPTSSRIQPSSGGRRNNGGSSLWGSAEPLLAKKQSRRRRDISTSSVTSFLSSVSVASKREQTPGYFKQLWSDVSEASVWAWLYLALSETAGMSLGVIILCGTKWVKEVWGFSPSQAALTIVLPQLLVIPVFCLLSLIDFPIFARVVAGNALIAIVALLPFLKHPAGWAAVIFFCELSNALRTSAQMPGFNKLVPEPRIARRFISISTVFIFTMRTLGFSGGSYLFDQWMLLPFLVCGVCQLAASALLVFVIWAQFNIHTGCSPSSRGRYNRHQSRDFDKSEIEPLLEDCQKSPESTASSNINEHRELN